MAKKRIPPPVPVPVDPHQQQERAFLQQLQADITGSPPRRKGLSITIGPIVIFRPRVPDPDDL